MEGTFSTCTKAFGRYKQSLHVHTSSSEHQRLSDPPQEQSCMNQAGVRKKKKVMHCIAHVHRLRSYRFKLAYEINCISVMLLIVGLEHLPGV